MICMRCLVLVVMATPQNKQSGMGFKWPFSVLTVLKNGARRATCNNSVPKLHYLKETT